MHPRGPPARLPRRGRGLSFLRFLVTILVRLILTAACRVDARELKKLPKKGPLLILTNHVNFLEVPVLYCWTWPRRLVGLAKRETWDLPVLGLLARLWEAIPLERRGGDPAALGKAAALLSRGRFLAMAPEGTRSGTGVLRRGHPGMVSIAVKAGCPVVAVAHHGGERFWDNLRRLRRTRMVIKVGEPFLIDAHISELTHGLRASIADEAMYELAALLPPRMRGPYGDPGRDAPRPSRLIRPPRAD